MKKKPKMMQVLSTQPNPVNMKLISFFLVLFLFVKLAVRSEDQRIRRLEVGEWAREGGRQALLSSVELQFMRARTQSAWGA